ncbi:hypothetical protein [Corynebacterium pygosceleis]|uniref:Secreted protein n=1 Tax=Corynebacterium pygosceleis TaxID=2800406 RepID=A0ABT3WXA7_9CORY|nr:hypothetical protein [Corynebacterium pygosceleis]MCK7675374.1 hypothetical protein [Corynebacterium pygosceleis]MCL0121232.1 hypothetical protein [Corynebacterium pygosceleis]MCX7445447.1 hypothetical protein [Corynebacterium pygosceleis]
MKRHPSTFIRGLLSAIATVLLILAGTSPAAAQSSASGYSWSSDLLNFGSSDLSSGSSSSNGRNHPTPGGGTVPVDGLSGDPDAVTPLTPSEPLVPSIVPGPDTYVAPNHAVISSTATGTGSDVTLLNIAADQAPAIGGYFVVNLSQNVTTGVIGRVTDVSVADSGLLKVTSVPVPIMEAYDEFVINTEVDITDAIIVDSGTTGTDERGSGNGKLPLNVPGNAWECTGDPGFELGLTGGDISIVVHLEFDPKARYMKFYTVTRTNVGAEASFGAGVSCTVDNNWIPEAFIPVGGPLGVTVGPEATFSTSGRVRLEASFEELSRQGYEINGDRYRVIRTINNDEATVTAEGEVETKLGFQVRAGVGLEFGFIKAGIAMGIGPELVLSVRNFTIEVTSDDSIETKSCTVEVSARFKGSIIGRAEIRWITGWEVKHEVSLGERIHLLNICSDAETTTAPPTSPPHEPEPGDEPAEPGGQYTRPGELTGLTVDQHLKCSVQSPEDGRSVFYDGDACATNIRVDGVTYGWNYKGGTEPLTPVSGPTVHGSGTATDPMVIRTSVAAGDTGVVLDQEDFFIEGSGSYKTTIRVRNTGTTEHDVILYRVADCYLNRDDFGSAAADSTTAACVATDGRRITYTEITPGSSLYAGHYDTAWTLAGEGRELPNSAEQGSHFDNGMAIAWRVPLGVGRSADFASQFTLVEPARRDTV